MADKDDKEDKKDGAKMPPAQAAPKAPSPPPAGKSVRVKNNHYQGLGFTLREGPQNPGGRVVFGERFGQEQDVTPEQANILLDLTYIQYDRETGRTETRKRFVRAQPKPTSA